MMADRPGSLLLERSLPDSLPDDGKGLLLERSLPDDGRQAEIKFQRIAKCSLQRGVLRPMPSANCSRRGSLLEEGFTADAKPVYVSS